MFIMLVFFILPMAHSLWQPEQVHLSWTENENEMQINWICFSNSQPVVEVWPVNCSDEGISVNISSNRFDFGENMPRVGYIYTARVRFTAKGCTFRYQVKNGPFKSQVFSFQGWTPGDPMSEDDKMIIYGDLGVSYKSSKVIDGMLEYLEENSVKGLIQVGDFAYDLFTRQGTVGDRFGEMIEPITAFYPFMTIPGNHETKSNYSHYLARYPMPKNEANEGLGLFYSFEAGLVRYILLNTNVFIYGTPEEQTTHINWLVEELEKAQKNREKNPWVVVLSHQPLYCFYEIGNSHSEFDCITQTHKLRKFLEEPYNKYEVDLVIQGHMHKYERDSTVFNNSDVSGKNDSLYEYINPSSPVYVISGNGGNDRGKRDPDVFTDIEWFRVQSQQYGFGVLTCFNSSHLLWEQLNSRRETVDYFYIVKR